jgi:hypothetical protein
LIPPQAKSWWLKRKLVEALPASTRWIRRARPETEIYETSFVLRPLMDRPGLVKAMVDFLEQAQ